MPSEAKISVIIPTFRRPEFLKRAVRSVLKQDYPDFKICIYDNASGDDTREVVSQFTQSDNRISYFCHPHNIGARANFQYGMEQVKTPFFSMLSDDDVLLPNFFSTAMQGFELHPDAGFSGGACLGMNELGEVLFILPSTWKRHGYFQPPDGILEILRGDLCGHLAWTSLVFRREVISKVGKLEMGDGVPSDIDFILKAEAHFPFYLSDEPCAIFLVHSENLHQMTHLLTRHDGWIRIMDNLKDYLEIPSKTYGAFRKKTERQLDMLLMNFWKICICERKFFDARLIQKRYTQKRGRYFQGFLMKVMTSLFQRFPSLGPHLIPRSKGGRGGKIRLNQGKKDYYQKILVQNL